MKTIDKIKRTFRKKFRKVSLTEKVMNIRSQFYLLKNELNAHVMLDIYKIKAARANGKTDESAEARAKNGYYTRLLLEQAEADLENVVSDAELNRVINKAGKAIAKLNGMADFSPKIHMTFMNWQVDALNERMTKKPELVKLPEMEESVSLPENIIDRLLAGELISDCIKNDRFIIENDGIPQFDYESKSDTDAKYQKNLAELMKKIDDLS